MPSEVQEQLANVLGHFRSMAEEDERAEAEAREARLAERRERAAEEAEAGAEGMAAAEEEEKMAERSEARSIADFLSKIHDRANF